MLRIAGPRHIVRRVLKDSGYVTCNYQVQEARVREVAGEYAAPQGRERHARAAPAEGGSDKEVDRWKRKKATGG